MDKTNLFLHDCDYDNEMRNIAVPFTKKFEKDGYFEAYDKTQIYYRTYILENGLKNIVIVHGFTENSEKYREIIYYFLKCGFNVFVFDLRGHGYSDRLVSDMSKVHVNDFDDYVKDLEFFVEKIVKPSCYNKPLCVFSHSMGAAVAILYLEKNSHVFEKAVLSTPMVVQRTYVPGFLLKLYIRIMFLLNKDESYLPFVKRSFPQKERFDLVSNGSKIRYSYYYKICRQDEKYRNFSGTIGWMHECIVASDDLKKAENIRKIDIPLLVYGVKKDTRVRFYPIKRFCKIADDVKYFELKNEVRHEVYTADEPVLKEYMCNVLEFFN